MVAPKFMLDTNICIYIQRRKPVSVLERFATLKPGQAVISVITWGELLYGAAKSRHMETVLKALAEFIELIPVLAMPPEVGHAYGQVRAHLELTGQPIGNNDLWIAAHALTADLTLVSNNTREFERIPDLRVENWSQLSV